MPISVLIREAPPTKFVLMDENENILDSFYAPNEGDPLLVAKKALIAMRDKYEKKGVSWISAQRELPATVRCSLQKPLRQSVMWWKQ